jgi:uncharacterized protein YlxW (UPF0749 family)
VTAKNRKTRSTKKNTEIYDLRKEVSQLKSEIVILKIKVLYFENIIAAKKETEQAMDRLSKLDEELGLTSLQSDGRITA